MKPQRNGDLPQELLITRLLFQRLEKEDCLRPEDRQSVAYRVSEIMVAAKDLYTESLPRLLQQTEEPEIYTALEDLTGLRMALLHLHDLISDFEDAFMDSMTHERETDDVDDEEDED